MHPIPLDLDASFRITRSLVFETLKTSRRVSDAFGDELQLTPASRLDQPPAPLTAQERGLAARNLARFFQCPALETALEPLPTLGDWARTVLALAGERPEALTFATSGSTGEPKLIRKPFLYLEQDAHCLAAMLPAAQRVVGLVPPHHIYGLLHTVLLPLVLRVPCVDLRFFLPGALLDALRPGDAVMGIPHGWKLLHESGRRFPPGVTGFTATGPCPPDLIHALRRQGLELMHEIYGSSESGAMGHRSSPEAPLKLMPTWERVGENAFARRLPQGGRTAPVPFQDALDWVDATHFRVRGRLDNAVQVAGSNVFPERIAQVLREHPAVADCAVRLMRPEEGDRLKAFVVPAPGVETGPPLLEIINRHLAARLGPLELPRAITFGPSLPRNDMGKLCDWPIARPAGG